MTDDTKPRIFCGASVCVHNKLEYHKEQICTSPFVAINTHGRCQTMQLPPPQPIPGQTQIEVSSTAEPAEKTEWEKCADKIPPGHPGGYAFFD